MLPPSLTLSSAVRYRRRKGANDLEFRDGDLAADGRAHLGESDAVDVGLEVDGGVKGSNIAEIAKWGADTFVAGTAIFDAPNYKEAITEMKNAANLSQIG